MQVHMHYAPRDSKTYPVERVMANLNEAVGDGHFISVNKPNLREKFSDEDLFSMQSTPPSFKGHKSKSHFGLLANHTQQDQCSVYPQVMLTLEIFTCEFSAKLAGGWSYMFCLYIGIMSEYWAENGYIQPC